MDVNSSAYGKESLHSLILHAWISTQNVNLNFGKHISKNNVPTALNDQREKACPKVDNYDKENEGIEACEGRKAWVR